MGDKKSMQNRMMFWKKSKEPVSTADAITRIRNLQEMLEKKSEWLESKIEKETQVAVENRTKNKRAALQALRRRKRWQKQLQNIDGTMTTVEVQLQTLTEASLTTEVMRCMQESSQALHRVHGNMSADKIADLKDDLQEMIEDSNEIQDLLAQPLGQDVDEDELLAELEEMEQDELTDTLCDLHFDLPPVPTHKVTDKPKERIRKKEEEEEEEEELRKLAEMMS